MKITIQKLIFWWLRRQDYQVTVLTNRTIIASPKGVTINLVTDNPSGGGSNTN